MAFTYQSKDSDYIIYKNKPCIPINTKLIYK